MILGFERFLSNARHRKKLPLNIAIQAIRILLIKNFVALILHRQQ